MSIVATEDGTIARATGAKLKTSVNVAADPREKNIQYGFLVNRIDRMAIAYSPRSERFTNLL
ncbi:MAG TPA: hypothetical protein V6C78_33055 [Crinalium sp.]